MIVQGGEGSGHTGQVATTLLLPSVIDALGGITVNVNYYVPINGISGQKLPDDYIEPGPAQHMDGWTALQFARGRYGLTDYDRMARQLVQANRRMLRSVLSGAPESSLLEVLAAEVRAWAVAHGIPVSAKGRVAAEVTAAFLRDRARPAAPGG